MIRGFFIVAILVATSAYAADTNPLVPFPSPLSAASGGGGGGGTIGGTCPTPNAIAYFSAATTITCSADLQWDNVGKVMTVGGSIVTTVDNTFDIGSFGLEWANVRAHDFTAPASVDALANGIEWAAGASHTAFAPTNSGVNSIELGTTSRPFVSLRTGASGGTVLVYDETGATYNDAATKTWTLQNTGAGSVSLSVVGDTLSTGVRAVHVTATLPATASTEWAVYNEVTSNVGASGTQFGVLSYLLPGFTGAAQTAATQFSNGAAGTLNNLFDAAVSFQGNFGFEGLVYGSTVGANVGGTGNAANSSVLNIGLLGQAITDATTGDDVGVIGQGGGSGASKRVGGYFFTSSNGGVTYSPTMTNGALVADNGDVAAPIFVGRDHGTNVFVVEDGGNLDAQNTPAAVDAGSGSCTVVTVTGSSSNVRGSFTATCNVGQTVVLNYGAPNPTAAQTCVPSSGMKQTTSTASGTTFQALVALAGDNVTYFCIE